MCRQVRRVRPCMLRVGSNILYGGGLGPSLQKYIMLSYRGLVRESWGGHSPSWLSVPPLIVQVFTNSDLPGHDDAVLLCSIDFPSEACLRGHAELGTGHATLSYTYASYANRSPRDLPSMLRLESHSGGRGDELPTKLCRFSFQGPGQVVAEGNPFRARSVPP